MKTLLYFIILWSLVVTTFFSYHLFFLVKYLRDLRDQVREHNRIARLVHNIYDETTQVMIVDKPEPKKK